MAKFPQNRVQLSCLGLVNEFSAAKNTAPLLMIQFNKNYQFLLQVLHEENQAEFIEGQ